MADKRLFTPGPLTTSPRVKQALLRDLGSRDSAFIDVIRDIRRELLRLGGPTVPESHESVLMQGSGTFAIESTIGSVIPPDGKLLVVINGAYGRRMADMAERLGIHTIRFTLPENQPIDPHDIAIALAADAFISHVGVIHCETTTGLLNPIAEIGAAVRHAGRLLIADAMSSFGGVELDLNAASIDYLVSSANKCIQGVPGFGFVLARREPLAAAAGWARSLSLDLHAQWRGLEKDGQFRFTPPTHTLLAFREALAELVDEGGIPARAARYARNRSILLDGLASLGLDEYLPRHLQSSIIMSYRYPAHPAFQFDTLYQRLSDRGLVIYPGKVSDADCFRIGCIGHLFEDDFRELVAALGDVLSEMGVPAPAGGRA
ncbi:MAG: 2-aminoethylphosphonate--pyruvate transaminase [Bryobacteraceae bacterium]|nr:2-aminoethylphosphonate--pyruvate transaminase [Bryobacteraceae bacterium]